MNAYLNYLIEANAGLVIILIFYRVFLLNENTFLFKRAFLLTGIMASILFPLLHLNFTSDSAVPRLGELVPYWLPEVTVGEKASDTAQQSFNVWNALTLLYWCGCALFLLLFLVQLGGIIKAIWRANARVMNGYRILESTDNRPAFSFFQFIFIGKSNEVSDEERMQIILHENVHVRKLHSIDIILVNLIGIVFWFNPLIRYYKRNFVQLHEFEADARAVENTDVNKYCNLLARVALMSADMSIANHFNNSLTLKRIAMLRTMKNKIHAWKVAAALVALPLLFVVIACQDQVMDDVNKVAESSTMAVDIPVEVQKQVEDLKAADPAIKIVVIETTTEEGKASLDKIKAAEISSVHVIKTKKDPQSGQERSFVVIRMDATGKAIQERTTQQSDEGAVFMVVEEPAQPKDGMVSFHSFMSENLEYPVTARDNKIQGTVFLEFIVEKDGSISNLAVKKGIGSGCDEAALAVMQKAAPWAPAKQNGKVVRSKMILPVKFAL